MYYGPDDEMVIVPWTVSRRCWGTGGSTTWSSSRPTSRSTNLTEKAVKRRSLGERLQARRPRPSRIWNTVKNPPTPGALRPATAGRFHGGDRAVTLAIGGLGVINIMARPSRSGSGDRPQEGAPAHAPHHPLPVSRGGGDPLRISGALACSSGGSVRHRGALELPTLQPAGHQTLRRSSSRPESRRPSRSPPPSTRRSARSRLNPWPP